MSETVSFCPACVGTPESVTQTARAAGDRQIVLSVPGVHCVACINGIERALMQMPEVAQARVNLSMKRVTIGTLGPVTPEALIDQLQNAGFAAHLLDASLLGPQSDQVGRILLTRIAVAGFAMMNVMLLSVAVWSGAAGATQHLFHLISAGIALPAILFAAQPFFTHAWSALSARRLNMDVPISLAIILAGGMSTYESLVGGHQAYFDAALSLTFFLLIGRYLDHRSRSAAASAAAQLSALEVPRVMRLDGGQRNLVDFADLAVGDDILVLAGGRIPVDGIIIKGTSSLDRAMLTGETTPIPAEVGHTVSAGEINLNGPLTIRATTVGDDTTLRKMVTMVDAAESVRNRYTAIADRAARIYAPVVHLLAFAAFAGWLIYSGDPRLSLNIAIAVLIITCPCALGLAVPAVATTAAGRLFRAGLLVKDGTALERLAEVDTIVLDKTGTLTMPEVHLTLTKDESAVALGLAMQSAHPVSVTLAAQLERDGITAHPITQVTDNAGLGVSGSWNGMEVRLGSGAWLGSEKEGTFLKIGELAPVEIQIAGSLRQGAQAVVAAWQGQGYAVHMLSGDTRSETRRIAKELNIDAFDASVSPANKIDYVQRLSDQGARVLMVGDGLNDTGALAAAYASISPASAADASRAASDVVLLGQDLDALSDILLVAKSARRRVLENFGIAACYNAVAIPIALAGLATPLLAAIAMSASSIMVVLNALRLRGRA